jgi:hypothetical protein
MGKEQLEPVLKLTEGWEQVTFPNIREEQPCNVLGAGSQQSFVTLEVELNYVYSKGNSGAYTHG